MTNIPPVRPNGISTSSERVMPKPPRFSFGRFAVIFLFFFVLICISGGLNYRQRVRTFEEATHRQIEAIGNLKADQIADWLEERRGDALTLFNSRLGASLQAFLADPRHTAAQRPRHLMWLHSLVDHYDYSRVTLLDAEGHPVLSVPEAAPGLQPETRVFIEHALHTRQVVFSDLYRVNTRETGEEAIRLDYVVPLLVDRNPEGFAVGALLLRIDPYEYLYPRLQQWPLPSRSAETLLVRSEGEEVIFLSPLRYYPNAPLYLRLPLSTPELPAAKALRDKTGEISGRDYRGVPVLAALRAIPDTAWYVVAKIDQQEVYEPLQQETVRILLITLSLMAATTFLAWGYWRRYNETWVRRTNRFLESQLKAQTAELWESETRLRLALQASQVGLWDWDLQTQAVYLSSEWKRQLGYEDHELPNRFEEWEKRLHPEDHDRTLEKTMAYVKHPAGSDFENEFRLRHRDGSYRWILVRAALFTDEAGKPLRMMGSHTDITERKQTEERLQLWQHVMASTKNGLAVVNATREDYPVIAVNPAFERITGYPAAEVLGRNLRFLYGEDREQPGLEILRSAIHQQRSCEVVLRNYRKDGTLFWNSLYIAPLRNSRGQVTHFIGVQDDITERKTYEAQLEFQANYDSLTQLPNRNLLQNRLQHAIAHAQRAPRSLGVLFVDLDHFKVVNETLNHAMGDSLLQSVAGRLKDCVRESDTVARLGSDEFVLLLEDLSQPELAKVVADRVMDTTLSPYTLEDYDFFLSASIGISLFPRDGEDGPSLLKNAEIAMHRAKEKGRHRIEFYSPGLNEHVQRRMTLDNGLRQALAHEELMLYYQPQADLNSNRVTGVEALLRWHHRTLGMISPAEFIPLAEESGLIVPLGEWVLRTACAQLKTWQTAGLPILTVGVNLSARQFLEGGLIEMIASILEETELNPASLELEITESMLMHDMKNTITLLQRLRTMGVRLAIDDFGTGYSSLGYLKRFPLDRLKIDRSFVSDIAHDPDDAAIALAVIVLARTLGLEVIAEGVETEAQLAFLRDKGCDAAQGYLLSRPLPADELMTFLLQTRDEAGGPRETDVRPAAMAATESHRTTY